MSNLQATLTICDMKTSLRIQLLIFALTPTVLFAHEGHGFTKGNSPLHYLAEPFHAVVLLVAVSAIAGVVYYFRKQQKKS